MCIRDRNKGDYVVPDQFSHNISFSYSLQKGRYNVSLECRNFTDEKLYDNFSLQKAGRLFMVNCVFVSVIKEVEKVYN